MIKFDDVLAAASKCLNNIQVSEIKRLEQKSMSLMQRNFVRGATDIVKNDALESVYNGDCDMVVFSRYRDSRDFLNLYNEYKNEQYAAGS